MSSVMLRKFSPYGSFCRFSGSLFIQNFRKRPEFMRAKWMSWYTLYSAFCFAVFSAVQASYIFKEVIQLFTNIRIFTKSLFFVTHFAIVTKIVVNLSSSILGTTSMIRFFEECAVFEKSTGFSPPDPPRRLKLCHCIRFVMFTSFLVCSTMSTVFLIKMLHNGSSLVIDVIVKIACVFFNYIFFVYDTQHFLILRPCSQVLILYIRAQADRLSSLLCVPDYPNRATVVGDIEKVRLNVCTIRNLKMNLNGVWKASIVTSSMVILLMVCAGVDSAFDSGVPRAHVVLTLSYCLYSTLDLVDVATLSQTMVNEAQKLKDSLKSALTFQAPESYVHQVHYLHDSLNPNDMALSGGGFFRLDMALLVSMTGSIITYTVILVQTSEGAEHSLVRNVTRCYEPI